jgi:hypothetical protein
MNSRFFKRAARKTVVQGLSSWFLYQAFNILESNVRELRQAPDVEWELFMTTFAIPVLATIGVEIMTKKLFDREFDIEIAVRNSIVAALAPLLLPGIGRENSVPILLYALGIIDFNDVVRTPAVAPEINSQPGSALRPNHH